MKIPRNHFGKVKTVLHGLQAAFVFLGFCLTAAILVNGETDGRSKYYFSLCFFTIPALVYLVMVPRWERAAKIANVHVFALVDMLFAILWLAAFIAVATYNPDSMNQDSEDEGSEDETENEDNDDGGGCSALCNTNKASVAFGVFNFLLFLATSGISFFDIMQYRRDGTSVIIQSSYQKTSSSAAAGDGAGAVGLDAHSKDAWSADTGELNESGYHRNPRYDHDDDDDNDDDGDDEFHNGYNGYGRVENHGAAAGAGAAVGGVGEGRLGRYNDVDDDENALLGAASQPGRGRPSVSGFGLASGSGPTPAAPAGYGDVRMFNEDTAYHAAAAAPAPAPATATNNHSAPGKLKFPDGNYSFSG